MDLFENSELTKKEEKYRKEAQIQIEYCVNCQPFDEGEAVWIHGERTSLEDLFTNLKIPERYWEKISEHLFCPNCADVGIELGGDIGIKSEFEIEIDNYFNQVTKKYGKKIKEFEELMENYPLLGLSHYFGRKILKELEAKTLPTVNIKGNFFRARKVTSSEVFEIENMYNPPKGKPLEGRFNHSGQSHLYLAKDKETAIKEVMHNEKRLLVWVQEFKLKKTISNILNLSFDWSDLTPSTSALILSLKSNNSIDRNDRNIDYWKPDYHITRFIMDCARKTGYHGIMYNSTKIRYQKNIVLFYPDNSNIEPVENPKIEIFSEKQFFDENNDLPF